MGAFPDAPPSNDGCPNPKSVHRALGKFTLGAGDCPQRMIQYDRIDAMIDYFAQLPFVVVDVGSYAVGAAQWLEENSKPGRRHRYNKEEVYRVNAETIIEWTEWLCRRIAKARMGRRTAWNDHGEKTFTRMLESIMPSGYERAKG